MQYDPIKKSLGTVFNNTPALRRLFYKLLDLLLLRAWHIKKELNAWKATAPEQPFILDGGAGFGQYVFYLSNLIPNASITGVDVKKEQIEDCNNFFSKIGKAESVAFEYADLTKFSPNKKFDLVISVDVMEHILDDVAVFKNFYSAMNTNGMLLISTPSDQGGSDVHDHDHDEDGGFIDEHVRDGYNMHEIKDKLESTGFTDISAHYSYGWPGKLSWKLSMKFPILMLNVSRIFFILLPFYYLIAYPISFILNIVDLNRTNTTGTGLIVKAYKR